MFRRRKNRRRNGKNRQIGPTGSDIDEYGPRNNLNDYNGDDSSSSFHRDTSNTFHLNSGMCYNGRVNHLDVNIIPDKTVLFMINSFIFSAESIFPLLSFYLLPIMIFQWMSCYYFGLSQQLCGIHNQETTP